MAATPSARTSRRARTPIASAAALVVEAALVWPALHGGVALLGAFCVHVALVLLARSVARRSGADTVAMILPILIAATGPFGAAVCLVAGALTSRATGSSSAASLPEVQDPARRPLPLSRIPPSARSAVEPFQDILARGTVQEKQAAIARMMRYFDPLFAPLLKSAVRDECAAVRVQAATAVAKLERDFMSRSLRLERAAAGGDRASAAQLARLLDEQTHLGLLDPESERVLAERACQIYEACLKEQDDPDMRIRWARLELRRSRPARAKALLAKLVEVKEPAEPEAVVWYLEALFRLGALDQVHAIGERYRFTLHALDEDALDTASPARAARGAQESRESTHVA